MLASALPGFNRGRDILTFHVGIGLLRACLPENCFGLQAWAATQMHIVGFRIDHRLIVQHGEQVLMSLVGLAGRRKRRTRLSNACHIRLGTACSSRGWHFKRTHSIVGNARSHGGCGEALPLRCTGGRGIAKQV